MKTFRIILLFLFLGAFSIFNLSYISGNNTSKELSLTVLKSRAQNYNESHGSMTWDDVLDGLIALDYAFAGLMPTQIREEIRANNVEFNTAAVEWLHATFDLYDLSGDPVINQNGIQIDDCDGQPNAC